MNIARKTALVTGGAVRMGRAICEALAAKGCNVVIHYDRSGKEAASLAKDLCRCGVRAFTVQSHLSSQKDCEKVISQAWKKAGRLDFLINNAAVFEKDTLMSATEETMRTILTTNAFAPMMLTRAFAVRIAATDSDFARKLRRDTCVSHGAGAGINVKPAGKVVNLLDRRIAGVEAGCMSYLLSKKLLAELTRIAALELAPAITVNGVAPGAILPPPPGSGVRDLAGKTPLGRKCSPDEVAEAVIFLLKSDGITGQTIFVDGGQHLL